MQTRHLRERRETVVHGGDTFCERKQGGSDVTFQMPIKKRPRAVGHKIHVED